MLSQHFSLSQTFPRNLVPCFFFGLCAGGGGGINCQKPDDVILECSLSVWLTKYCQICRRKCRQFQWICIVNTKRNAKIQTSENANLIRVAPQVQSYWRRQGFYMIYVFQRTHKHSSTSNLQGNTCIDAKWSSLKTRNIPQRMFLNICLTLELKKDMNLESLYFKYSGLVWYCMIRHIMIRFGLIWHSCIQS